MTPVHAQFLSASTDAVAGASNQRHKYGNRVFRALLAGQRSVFPLNPTSELIEGHRADARVADLPQTPQSLSIVTPPVVNRQVVSDAVAAGVQHLWMQPGAEDEKASAAARRAGLSVIDDGSCLLVLLAQAG
jgi:predicted CoA-binding protein